MKHNVDRQAAQSRSQQEPYRVERRFTPGRQISDVVKNLVQAHST